MSTPISEAELQAILDAIAAAPDGVSLGALHGKLTVEMTLRRMRHCLQKLVREGRVVMEGKTRGAKYCLPDAAAEQGARDLPGDVTAENFFLKQTPEEIRQYIKQPVQDRPLVAYNQEFLYGYRPNETFYLTEEERSHLYEVGRRLSREVLAGTYAKSVLDRLLIDLSWNSSRLEGNTYSLLDTERLVNFGQAAEDKDDKQAQMILNHKDAIEFLVESAEAIGFDRRTILNLHALLANNLLPNPAAEGCLRDIPVRIGGSKFMPVEIPQLLNDCFEQVLASAANIHDPFEQAFFIMVQLPYLQPFEDVNKRVTRLAVNIPLIQANLVPLTFVGVDDDEYKNAILGVYELNQVRLLKQVFMDAYEASAQQYAVIRETLGEPDPFRLKYRLELKEVVRTIVLEQLGRQEAFACIAGWAGEKIAANDQEAFRELAEKLVVALHEGNYAHYQVSPTEFSAWQEVWNRPINPDLLLP